MRSVPEAEAVGLKGQSPAGWEGTNHGGTEYTEDAQGRRSPYVFGSSSELWLGCWPGSLRSAPAKKKGR